MCMVEPCESIWQSLVADEGTRGDSVRVPREKCRSLTGWIYRKYQAWCAKWNARCVYVVPKSIGPKPTDHSTPHELIHELFWTENLTLRLTKWEGTTQSFSGVTMKMRHLKSHCGYN